MTNLLSPRELRENAQDMIGKDLWKTLPEHGQKEIIESYDRLYQSEFDKVENILREIRERRKNQTYLLLGVMLGISGGVVGSILDRHFEEYGFWYELFAVALFIGLIFTVNAAFNLAVNRLFHSNDFLVKLKEKAEEELSKDKTSPDINNAEE
jgi:hypothetical protein